MKRKLLITILGVMAVSTFAAALAACTGTQHTAVHHAAVAPTCGTDGTIEYWSCEDCDELFADEACTQTITDIVDPATGNHTYGADYDSDSEGHWQVCEVCGQTTVSAEHAYGTEYFSDESGHWYECSVCGETSAVTAHDDWSDDNVCLTCGYDAGGTSGLAYVFTDDTQTAYKVYSATGAEDVDIVIPSTYKGLPVTAIGSYAFFNIGASSGGGPDGEDYYTMGYLSVTVSASVVEIEDYAFYRNIQGYPLEDGVLFEEGSQLKIIGSYAFANNKQSSLTIPDQVEYIDDYAFYLCSNWFDEYVELPSTLKYIGNYAFSGCGFMAINIPDSVTYIGNSAFSQNTSLLSIVIPDSVEELGTSLFSGCVGLQTAVLPAWLTVLPVGTFLNCTSLTSVSGPTAFTEIGNNAFYGTASITADSIPSLSSVMTVGNYAFNGCTAFTEIELPSAVTIGNYAFRNCTALAAIELPLIETIGNYAFSGCTALTEINLPSVVTIGSNAFNGSGLTSVELPSSVTSIGASAFTGTPYSESHRDEYGVLYVGNCLIDVDETFTATDYVITSGTVLIADSAFGSVTTLQTLVIPASVAIIGSQALPNTLTTITLPDGNDIFAARGGNLINESTKTLVLALSSFEYIPEDIVAIGDYAFYGNTAITSITIPDSVVTIGNYAFYNCSALTSVTFGGGVESIGNYAFRGAALEGHLDLSGVTEVGTYAFYNLSGITSADLSTVVTIGIYAFRNTGLTGIIDLSSVQTIGNYAFNQVAGITVVILSGDVISIGTSAFNGTSVSTVYYYGTEESYSEITFGSSAFGTNNVTWWIRMNAEES